MNHKLKQLENAKHIMIVCNSDHLVGASALYSYILQLHKKVSLVVEDSFVEPNLSFLPWFDKIRTHKTSSSDFCVEFDYSCVELYEWFKNNDVKINKKMATALYGGFLQESDSFSNSTVDGTIFAYVSELIASGADYKICNSFITNRVSLATLRLKAMMFKDMKLLDDARVIVFEIGEDELKASGASIKNSYSIIKEALKLPTTEVVLLLDRGHQHKLLKIIYKET